MCHTENGIGFKNNDASVMAACILVDELQIRGHERDLNGADQVHEFKCKVCFKLKAT